MKAVLLLALACTVAAQSPTFDVASVKREAAPVPGNFSGRFSGCGARNPGSYTCSNATVALMAFQAYGLKQYQMVGANDDPDKYAVDAKGPLGATPEDVRLMLQNLLADRFKLKFHYDKKEAQVFELRVAKSGLKMKKTATSGKSGTMTAGNLLQAPVIDATGLTGKYDFP